MTDISKLCMVCLSTKDENGVCPRCKKATSFVQKAPGLPLQSIIAGRYCIARAVKHNSEGITYLAYDIKTDKPVSVREFYPEALVSRGADEITVMPNPGSASTYEDCHRSFVSLWHKLLRLKGLTALISVNEVIDANGTTYGIYAESEACTLRDYLLQTQEGFLSWDRARILFMPVLSTLGTLHTSGIVHRGINPSSFIFSKDGKLKLTDFCIEQSRTLFGDLDSEVFDGYTPYEQYIATGRTGPWTDIYSFCSVLYRSLIGTTPIDAKSRALNDQMMIPAKFAENLPPYVINALIYGMQVKPQDRTNNIEQLRSDLSASPRAIGASAPVYVPPKTPVPPREAAPAPAAEDATKPITAVKAPPKAVPKAAPKQDVMSSPEMQKSIKENKSKNILIAVLVVLLLILVTGIGVLIKTVSDSKPQNEITTSPVVNIAKVPNFVGQSLSNIMNTPEYTGFFKLIPIEQADPSVPNGQIIKQLPPPDATASRGEEVQLFVSSGPRTVVMPDLTDKTYEQAAAELQAMGMKYVKSGKQNTDSTKAGLVAETIPPAASKVKVGETVTIVVYADNSTEETTEERLTGGNSVEEFLSGFTPAAPSA